MRIPEDRPPGFPQQWQEDQSRRYLAPGAFTVLSTEEHYEDPPPASISAAYKLTPTSRRHKNQAFSIIAEPVSNPGSRSPSPSGRVSPFRGRGFNPVGSRHASPAPSPPPQESRKPVRSQKSSPKKSQIPLLSRKSSDSLFGENVRDGIPHSKSSPNVPAIRKPLPNSRRTAMHAKASAFQQLSPIIGSSPEPATPEQDKSQSSRIPRSRSTPPSRQQSPARKPPLPDSRHTPRLQSRSGSKEELGSPARKSFQNVQAKVNSFNRVKPKVPPKPQEGGNRPNGDIEVKKQKPQLTRKESTTKIGTGSSKNALPSKYGRNNGNSNSGGKTVNRGSNENLKSSNKAINGNSNAVNNNVDINKNVDTNKNSSVNSSNNSVNTINSITKSVTTEQNKERVVDNINKGSLTSISNSTKTKEEGNRQTNAQGDTIESALPKVPVSVFNSENHTNNDKESSTIDAVMDDFVKGSKDKITPIVDGRVLSATSVSNAINKMNDTVLSTNTLMKDHNFSKISPAASAIISMSSSAQQNKTYDSKNLTDSSENEEKDKTPSKGTDGPNGTLNSVHGSNNNNNNTEFIKLGHTVSGINRFSADRLTDLGSVNSVQKSINDRLIDVKTVVTADVKPLKINVKEKPQNVDVQSGNVRAAVATVNGIGDATPGLPPPEAPTEQNPDVEQEKPVKTYARFLDTCRKKMSCKCCKRKPKTETPQEAPSVEIKDEDDEKPKKVSCFSCRKKKPDAEERVNLAETEATSAKKSCWERLKCCRRNGDGKGCCSRLKRKERWAKRMDSILSEPAPKQSKCSKLACRNFFRKVFCMDRCCKRGKSDDDQLSRRESVLSKKKSLSSTVPPPPEDNKPKLDLSLVEHTSLMKGAIPVLPVKLAWFCLICNIFIPGSGTVFSGLFCLCIGIPRFSQKDGPKPRIGAFIIDLIIGCGQLFTVLFCLVGWGWSIWWGLTMLKLAKKYRKIKILEQNTAEQERPALSLEENQRDVERGGH